MSYIPPDLPKIKKPKKEKGLLKGVLIGLLIALSFRLIENIIVKFALIFAP